MTHSQIGARFGKQQVANFLSGISRLFFVTSCIADTYNVYTAKFAQLVFSGSANDVFEFLDRRGFNAA